MTTDDVAKAVKDVLDNANCPPDQEEIEAGTNLFLAVLQTLNNRGIRAALSPEPREVFHRETTGEPLQIFQLPLNKMEFYFVHHSAALAEAFLQGDLFRQIQILALIKGGGRELQQQGLDEMFDKLNKLAYVAFTKPL